MVDQCGAGASELTGEELAQARVEAAAEVDALRAQYKATGERLLAAIAREKLLKEEHVRRELENPTSGANDNWQYLLQAIDATSHCEAARKALAKYGLDVSGYHAETGQRVVTIAFYDELPVVRQRVLLGLSRILPFLKADRRGEKAFSVREPSLSQFGSLVLVVLEDGECELRRRRHGRDQIGRKFESLAEALQWIQAQHCFKDVGVAV